ncbi:hypothetical protein KIH77_01900 [Bifidobacterium sp. 82T24]|uniref:hypothetical protein n=1 Tax=Bifidobacterium pluvialisilvae TaxID=2834436 RepID=UPI001C56AFFD|nr:hypothetical protein [Bifidobacterium pluvialisilvae]MBW3087498.1 hypothetical protein [Bifidobacterium pluvialisilvae]
MANETTDDDDVMDTTTHDDTAANDLSSDADAITSSPDAEDEDERTSSQAVRQLSVVAVVLGVAAIILCFVPHVSLMIALGVAIAATVIGLVNCLSSTVLHDSHTRIVAAAGTLAGAVAILITLFL